MQVQRVLAELITGLAEPARQTVLLRYYEGLTSEQIGAIMGVPAGSVRRRLKEAVDELRDQLDRRHQGRSWLLALLPVGAELEPGDSDPPTASPTAEPASLPPAEPASLPPVATVPIAAPARRMLATGAGVSLPTLAIGALVVSVVAGGLWLAWPSSSSQPPGGPAGGAAPPPANRPGGGRWLAAAVPGTFPSCRADLAERRKELTAAETVYLRRAPKDVLFEEGSANPTARAALLPELERLIRGDRGAGPSFTVECRTWACRLLVLRPRQGPNHGRPSLPDISRHPSLSERLADGPPMRDRTTRDPITGATFVEETIYLVLKVPSGARVAGSPPPIDAAAAPRPEPRTLQDCQRELRGAAERLAYLRRVKDDRMSLVERHRESEYDPALTLDMKALVTRALEATGEIRTPDGATLWPDVLCRGRVCRVSFPGEATPDAWRQQLVRDPALSKRISESVVTAEALMLALHEANLGQDGLFAKTAQLGRDILAAANLPTCAARFPSTSGDLHILLVFPVIRKATVPGAPPPAITVRLSGPLADTPLARCVEQDVTRAASAATLPAFHPGGSVKFARSFPLDPAQK
jgi:hypothetical protein